ncbi:PaeR7I family type II restriction endonuclease [Parafrigoribacterium humi]|uniref:PaeR7I family type II restriction endonuclease n=1 Tax=Parafrigoribacterium humi TaxID=3144664 RepID=UPI0032EC959E
MAIDLSDYEAKTADAVHHFWSTRSAASLKQAEGGKVDQGERAGVTSGKNMDGFVKLIADLVEANGLHDAEVNTSRALVTLPGYFRPTKDWDLVVTRGGRLIAAIELKSQVGPSFGNNFNNRTEEAIGTAHDFWTAYRENAFGAQPRPFVGWLMLVEDAPESRRPMERERSRHFKAFPEFEHASYLQRYEILCRRMVQEQLYTSASMITSSRDGGVLGEFNDMSDITSLKRFVATFSGHIAAEAVQ